MIETWAATLESLPLAVALKGSVWIYPLINAGHILGIALLIGGILPLDLRLLGVWPSVPVASLWRVLVYTAGTGLGLAMICGGLLFINRATTYLSFSFRRQKVIKNALNLGSVSIISSTYYFD